MGLVDWTGRVIREDKRGFIPSHIQSILQKINLTSEQWHVLSLDIQKESINMLHGLDQLVVLERKAQKQQAA